MGSVRRRIGRATCVRVCRRSTPKRVHVRRKSVLRTQKLTAILASARAFADALGKGNAAAVASLWAADGQYGSGTSVGRPVIEESYAEFFKNNPDAMHSDKRRPVKLRSETADQRVADRRHLPSTLT